MFIKNKIYFIYIFFIFLFFINIGTIHAATVKFFVPASTYRVGDTIKIKVIISSSESVNAISSKVLYTKNTLFMKSFSKSSSIISLWPTKPSFSNLNGEANFQGVILNGYTGSNGNTITLIFRAKSVGLATINFKNVSILANDGEGTEVFNGNLSTINLEIKKSLRIDKPAVIIPKEAIVDTTEDIIKRIDKTELVYNLPKYSLLVSIIIVLIMIIDLAIILLILLFWRLRRYYKKRISKMKFNISNDLNRLKDDINIETMKNSSENDKINIEQTVNISSEIEETKREIINEVVEIEKEL